jgi:hypothetical protein
LFPPNIVAATDIAECIHGVAPVGRTKRRRHVQRSLGVMRLLDEYEFDRSHLHIQRRRSLLETTQLLYSGISY